MGKKIPTSRSDICSSGGVTSYTSDQPLRNFVDDVGIQVVLYCKIRDEYCDKIADSFTELDWIPDEGGINRMRQDLKGPWGKAILVDWNLNPRN